ncbi:hypothetical protein, partial [Mesorhizobium sp. M2D.F.Ca.ET.153.01.1.1]|uniref:hypothetical protein n=1 Tax=Mesorhizobium sp. M2D.F.Ca.ET.153.01.1.1 TaxID=2500520 RepID=UPI001AEDCE6F
MMYDSVDGPQHRDMASSIADPHHARLVLRRASLWMRCKPICGALGLKTVVSAPTSRGTASSRQAHRGKLIAASSSRQVHRGKFTARESARPLRPT